MVVCSGCLDLFHFCKGYRMWDIESVIMASEYCHLSILAFMIENGSDINTKDVFNKSLIHYSAQTGHISVTEYLNIHGADLNAKTQDASISHFIGFQFTSPLEIAILTL